MSAFVCSPTHIATCAEIVHETVFDRHEGERRSLSGKTVVDPHRADIRLMLARDNLASVAWRYSDEGRAGYRWIVDELAASGWQAASAPETVGIESTVPGGSVAAWLAQCRWAAPLAAVGRAEAWRYLDCMAYRSCEHPGWSGGAAKRWIEDAQAALARELVRRALGGRHVWEARPPPGTGSPVPGGGPGQASYGPGGPPASPRGQAARDAGRRRDSGTGGNADGETEK